MGPVRASLLLALLWAVWHLPLFLISNWISSPFWIYLLILVGLSMIMTYGANLARFAVVTPIAMHAAFNTVSKFLAGLFTDTQPNMRISFELVLALCGLATALLLVVVTKARLAYRQDQNSG
jgi:membrane protease YdiL (CAAX protease family)